MILSTAIEPQDLSTHAYSQISAELIDNVRLLYMQLEAQYSDDRAPEERLASQMTVVDIRRHPDEIRLEGERMYQRIAVFLEKAQALWPLAEVWLSELRRWFKAPLMNSVRLESNIMTYGHNQRPYAFSNAPTLSPPRQTKKLTQSCTKSILPQTLPMGINTILSEYSSPRLAPPQHTSLYTSYVEPSSLAHVSPCTRFKQLSPPTYQFSH
ncbi:hypothetical protein JX266_014410, partial [Neoarthrinium moseri]